jgi:hypothetical protein
LKLRAIETWPESLPTALVQFEIYELDLDYVKKLQREISTVGELVMRFKMPVGEVWVC